MQHNGNLTVNGKVCPCTPGMTVTALLETLQTGRGMVVVEVNAEIIPCERFDETPLNPGDVIEIVHFVGGG